jgi:hypothetical protein
LPQSSQCALSSNVILMRRQQCWLNKKAGEVFESGRVFCKL